MCSRFEPVPLRATGRNEPFRFDGTFLLRGVERLWVDWSFRLETCRSSLLVELFVDGGLATAQALEALLSRHVLGLYLGRVLAISHLIG